MAYRQIHTKIWKDAWFLDLEPGAKLLFLYLCTNERTNILGLYDLPLKVVAFETDLPIEAIKAHLTSFERDGKVEYEGGWVWVKNLMRYNAQNLSSLDVQKHIRKTLAELPPGRLKAACAEYNTLPTPSYDPPLTIPPPVVQEQEQDQTQDQKQEPTEQETESGKPDVAPAPALSSFADWTIKLQTSKNRPAVLRDAFQAFFPGRDPPDFGYLGKTARAVGGAGRLLELLWQNSTRPPTGDVLAYCLSIGKRAGGNGRNEPAGFAGIRELAQEEGWNVQLGGNGEGDDVFGGSVSPLRGAQGNGAGIPRPPG